MSKKLRPSGVKTYDGKELTGYLVGLAGQNILYNIVGSGLMYYFQNVIFLPVMAFSVIVFIARVWDAINDPMMGTIVDKTNTKWGKCKPYLLFVPAIVMVVTILCFINGICTYDTITNPVTGEVTKKLIMNGRNIAIVAWAGISYILWGMSYTAGDIPLWGVTSLMTEDANDRSKVLSLARIVASVGAIGMLVQLAANSFSGIFAAKGYDTDHQLQYSTMIMAIILTVFASVLFQFSGLSVKEKVHQQTEEHHTMIENFKTMWNCKPFRKILISGVLRSPIQLLMTVAITLVLYFFFDNDIGRGIKNAEGAIDIPLLIRVAIIAVGIFGGMLIASAVTPMFTKKFEKKAVYNFYSVVGALPFGAVYVIYKIAGEQVKTNTVWAIIMGTVFFMASWSQGGINVLQSVMIADCVDYEEYRSGIRPDGVFFSGQSFIVKLSAGIATIISGIVFNIVDWSGGYIQDVNNALANGTAHFATDYSQYASAMFFLVAIPPMIGMIISAIPTWTYDISNKEHTEILSKLVERRHGAGQ